MTAVRFGPVAIAAALALVAAPAAAQCPEPAVTGTQPCDDELKGYFSQAASNTLGGLGPDLGTIGAGRPSTSVAARFPCALLRAIGQTESSWRQFTAGACGGTGPTLISFDCGYGIMQITSGMAGGAGFDPPRVAAEPAYDIGTGAQILGAKWRATPFVGTNDPDLVECWYYAVWAYNGFSYVNNPNNPRFAADRQPYLSPGGSSRGSYPYQELVWGYLEYPPADRWPSIPVSYPDRAMICSASGCRPGDIEMPAPTHRGDCAPPVVGPDAGVTPGADAGVLPGVDAGAPPAVDGAVAPLDSGGEPDAGASGDADGGARPPGTGSVSSGCGCGVVGARPERAAWLALSLGLALALGLGLVVRIRARRTR